MCLFLVYFLVTKVAGDQMYTATNSCLFTPMESHSTDSPIECAIKCSSVACKAFQFNESASICNLYAFNEICQSDTVCANVIVFVNERYNNMVMPFHCHAVYQCLSFQFLADSTGVVFQLFNGINFKFASGSQSVFDIINASQATPIIADSRNSTIAAVGTYRNSKLIVLPNMDMIAYFNKKSANKRQARLPNNFVRYLTEGICTNYSSCYHDIDEYSLRIGTRHLVFGITLSSKFNYANLSKQAIIDNWHFVICGTFWMQKVSPDTTGLMNLYGICSTKRLSVIDPFIKGNICKVPLVGQDVPSRKDVAIH